MPNKTFHNGEVFQRPIVVGLFLSSCAALMYELLLTRIFSVTLYYHLAFVAISVAMFGSATGATLAYLTAHRRRLMKVNDQLAYLALSAAVAIVVCIAIYVRLPTVLKTLDDIVVVAFGYAIVSIPFVFLGALTTIAFSELTAEISRLYAADLCGASLGCVVVIPLLDVASGPQAMIVAAFILAFVAVVLARHSAVRLLAMSTAIAVLLFAALNMRLPLLHLRSAKGFPETTPLLERWNTFSRVQVIGDPDTPRQPFGWGFGSRYVPEKTAHELAISIDAASGTVMTGYDGDRRALAYLRHDISNAAHYLRGGARVAVIGSGGGRDILSALAFNQRSVLGIEVNNNILRIVNGDYGTFTGHLDRQEGVRFVNDEARSYLTRTGERFDIVQISLIDTWAATAAGAFALTENSLYTVEAWQTFLERLTDDGILTTTRWYRLPRPFEIYRLCSLAATALRGRGVTNPREHLVLLRTPSSDVDMHTDVATLLVFKKALDVQRLAALRNLASEQGWQIALSPRDSMDPWLARASTGASRDPVLDRLGVQWSAPSDDRPFFFYTARMSSLLHPGRYPAESTHRALLLLGVLLATIVALVVVCILLPLAAVAPPRDTIGSIPLFLFFGAIGFGFMFIEVSQLQRLSIVLGPPVYALSVVLFTLLVTSGIGARLSAYTKSPRILLTVVLVTGLIGLIEGRLVAAVRGGDLLWRVMTAIIILAPIGFVMGLAFPLGMRIAERVQPQLRPWFCAINASTSVCGSVVATIVSMHSSITMTYWCGVLSYAPAAAVYWVMAERESTRLRLEAIVESGSLSGAENL